MQGVHSDIVEILQLCKGKWQLDGCPGILAELPHTTLRVYSADMSCLKEESLETATSVELQIPVTREVSTTSCRKLKTKLEAQYGWVVGVDCDSSEDIYCMKPKHTLQIELTPREE